LLTGYSVLTNGGLDIIPHSIVYITDRDGNVIHNQENEIYNVLNYKRKKKQIQLIEPSVAFIIRKMMQNVVNSGTARTVRNTGLYHGTAAGKTGSTSNWNDSWFAGATTDLAALSWIGMDNGNMTLGRYQSGGGINAPLWGEFMKAVYDERGSNPKPFSNKPPRGVRQGAVCKFTGKRPNSDCDQKEDITGTMMAAPIRIGRLKKRVMMEKCDCTHVKSQNFYELVQKQMGISDDEIGKTKKFKRLLKEE